MHLNLSKYAARFFFSYFKMHDLNKNIEKNHTTDYQVLSIWVSIDKY